LKKQTIFKLLFLKITEDLTRIFEPTNFQQPSVFDIKKYINLQCEKLVENINILSETKYIEYQKRIRNDQLLEYNEQRYKQQRENFKQSQQNEGCGVDDSYSEVFVEQSFINLEDLSKILIKSFTSSCCLKKYLKFFEDDIIRFTGQEYNQEDAEWTNSEITGASVFKQSEAMVNNILRNTEIMLFEPMIRLGYDLLLLKLDFALEMKQLVTSNINRYIDFNHFNQWIFSSIISSTEIFYSDITKLDCKNDLSKLFNKEKIKISASPRYSGKNPKEFFEKFHEIRAAYNEFKTELVCSFATVSSTFYPYLKYCEEHKQEISAREYFLEYIKRNKIRIKKIA
ncbi:hypothetical protein CDIK_3936, partial [Cucumispora dikerogammari]